MINKEMVEYYLDEDYNKWIANVLVDICNDENDIIHLKKEIYKAWQDHLESENQWITQLLIACCSLYLQ